MILNFLSLFILINIIYYLILNILLKFHNFFKNLSLKNFLLFLISNKRWNLIHYRNLIKPIFIDFCFSYQITFKKKQLAKIIDHEFLLIILKTNSKLLIIFIFLIFESKLCYFFLQVILKQQEFIRNMYIIIFLNLILFEIILIAYYQIWLNFICLINIYIPFLLKDSFQKLISYSDL